MLKFLINFFNIKKFLNYSFVLKHFILEAIDHNFKLVMVRPEVVSFARNLIDSNESDTLVGTVIDFPLGNSSLEDKIFEANSALDDGADELDFVINCDLINP